MALSFFLIIILTAGGFSLTYLFSDDEPILWRLSAGSIVGCAIFGTFGFLLACVFGLSVSTVTLSFLVTLAPLALFLSNTKRRAAYRDWQSARGKLQGANARKFLVFGYYLFFFIIFWLFFERAMLELPDGIYTGAAHNFGDLPFHLGAIFSFTDANNFPPQNPSFAGAKFSYPFIADIVTAGFMKFGAGAREAMFAQNLTWCLSLLVLLDRFVARVTGERFAGKIAAFLLFFSGGLGFLWFFSDLGAQASGFWDFLWKLPHDYTMGDKFSWGNSLITLFITQRSLLLGMPLTIVVLDFLWTKFCSPEPEVLTGKIPFPPRAILVGLIAGCLPLIHLHSLAVLFVVTLSLLLLQPEKWRVWVAFGVGVCVIAVPELVWSVRGSASKATEFIGWHFGWDVKQENILWFWFRNTGLAIPAILGGLLLVYFRKGNPQPEHTKPKKGEAEPAEERSGHYLLLFYLPFLFCFLVANATRLAPWEWDNIKVLIYWFVGSLPFAALAIIWLWRHGIAGRVASAICILVLTASGGLDVWRTVSGQIKYKVFEQDAVRVAEQIKKNTPPQAVFLNAPTFNPAVVLSGRLSLMRYTGHLWSHGIDYGQRETDVKQIYAGGPGADELLSKYNIDYVLFSPDERSLPNANEAYFRKYPVAAESGQYRVFKIR